MRGNIAFGLEGYKAFEQADLAVGLAIVQGPNKVERRSHDKTAETLVPVAMLRTETLDRSARWVAARIEGN
jgi:hypothetical protein